MSMGSSHTNPVPQSSLFFIGNIEHTHLLTLPPKPLDTVIELKVDSNFL